MMSLGWWRCWNLYVRQQIAIQDFTDKVGRWLLLAQVHIISMGAVYLVCPTVHHSVGLHPSTYRINNMQNISNAIPNIYSLYPGALMTCFLFLSKFSFVVDFLFIIFFGAFFKHWSKVFVDSGSRSLSETRQAYLKILGLDKERMKCSHIIKNDIRFLFYLVFILCCNTCSCALWWTFYLKL